MPRRNAQRQSLAPVGRDDEEERTMKRRQAASRTTNTASDGIRWFLGRQQQTRRASNADYSDYPESMHTRTPTPHVHLHGAKRPFFAARRDHGGEETAARLARRRVALSQLIGVIAIAGKNTVVPL
ncbi:hypothetical protein VC83_00865 [Pseudogymnoascus destructans]|uniref:Uncharacterized protein n=1 Tax=Pseudogymnoascus destructans TaxID=655981 RepID=A0A177AKB0_9PEZI|nr:uncharacterized protein VC83_00865 [Pseudogymnoascus destructans]OAF62465.1 hypothetical protein VC83_00865 [Pseudogymnoascus destructans]